MYVTGSGKTGHLGRENENFTFKMIPLKGCKRFYSLHLEMACYSKMTISSMFSNSVISRICTCTLTYCNT